MNSSKIKKGISIGVRVAALALIVLFFIPSFCVSCGDMEANVSGFGAAIGNIDVENSEENATPDPAPWLFILPILSALIIFYTNQKRIISMVCALGNIIMMFVFKFAVNSYVDKEFEGYLEIETKPAFAIYIVICILIILALAFDKFILGRKKNRDLLINIINWIKEDDPMEEDEPRCPTCGRILSDPSGSCPFCSTDTSKCSEHNSDSAEDDGASTCEEDVSEVTVDFSALNNDDSANTCEEDVSEVTVDFSALNNNDGINDDI